MWSEDGVQHGAPLATTSFCVAIHPEVEECDNTLEASVGLEVRFDKMHAYNADMEAARREAPADIDWPELDDRHGIPILNAPLGSQGHSLKRAGKLRRKAALVQAAVARAAAAAAAAAGAAAGVAAAVGNGPPAPVSDDGGSKEDDVMGVGEDPVGEDGMDIDAPAWPPAGVKAADEGVIREGDPGDFYMKVIAKKFRGVWHYGVITGVVTECVLEDYGGATLWRAVFEDGDTVDLLRSEVVEAMAAAQEHPPVDADGEARLVTVPEGGDLFAQQINRMKAHRLYREPNPNKKGYMASEDAGPGAVETPIRLVGSASAAWEDAVDFKDHLEKLLDDVRRTELESEEELPRNLLAEREDAKYTTMVARAQHFYLATPPPPPGADSDDSRASARPIRAALCTMVRASARHADMSSAKAADLGVDAGELLVAGIHARSQDVRAKCKCYTPVCPTQ
eukprot:jgi/Tetstr1/435236/TSEL_024155.t1